MSGINTEFDEKLMGQRIKKLREEKKKAMKVNNMGLLTMDSISKQLGVSKALYADWELGRRVPRGKNLMDLAKFYDTTVDYIYGYSEDPNPRNEKEIVFNKDDYVIINGEKTKLSTEQRDALATFFKTLTDD